ncbi:hypothetical protein WME88_56065 [Sorangium sp. So ce216]
MPTTKTRAKAHKERTVVRELKHLLKSVRILSETITATPAGTTPVATPITRKVIDHESRLARAWRVHSALSRAAGALERLERRVAEVRLDDFAATYRALETNERLRAQVERVLTGYVGPRAADLLRMMREMGPRGFFLTYGVISRRELTSSFQRWRDDFEFTVLRPALARRAGAGGEEGSDVDYMVCDQNGECRPVSKGTFWMLVAVLVIVVLITWIAEGVNELDDDASRAEISDMNCASIVAKPDSFWIQSFQHMIDGPTGDEDESAMLKVLKCLPPERCVKVIHAFGLEDFMDEFQGSEFDQLVLRLKECGLLNFSDWDDDATRLFIQNTSKAKLGALSINDIVTLCKNMFSGSCGDEDEAAIIRLISAQDLCKVKKILQSKISVDDFDDNVDGEEWDQLSTILWMTQFALCT